MSWEMQGVVAKLNHDISATEKWVLMILASFTNKEGKNAYPSARSIADICRVTERTVRRVRAKFFHNGVLTRGVGRRRSKGICYNINPDRTLVLHYREPEKADSVSGVERKKADRVSGFIGRPPVSESEKTDSQSAKADSGSGKPYKEPCNNSVGGPVGAGDGSYPLACMHWRESRPALVEMFGEEQVKAFLDLLVVGYDDGEIVELWCPTRFMRDHIDTEFREGLERILGCKVKVVLRNTTSIAISKRLAKQRNR